jgi:hypothetical protein
MHIIYISAIRSPVTKDIYLRRLRIFFNHIQMLSMNEPMETRCNMFAQKSRSAPKCAFTKILEFLQFQKERVESGEISPATLRNFVKAINLFSEMSDIFFCILFIVVCLFVYQYAAALPPLFVLVAVAALLPLLVTGEFAPAVTTDELWLCLFF